MRFFFVCLINLDFAIPITDSEEENGREKVSLNFNNTRYEAITINEMSKR